jgi:hypothetical protein
MSTTPLWIVAFALLILDLLLLGVFALLYWLLIDLRLLVRRLDQMVQAMEPELEQLSRASRELVEQLRDHPLLRFRPELIGLDRWIGRAVLKVFRLRRGKG